MKLTREFFRPKDAELKISNPDNGLEIWVYERQGQLFAAMFAGKRAKPDQHYRYLSEESRTAAIAKYVASVAEIQTRKEQYKKESIKEAKAAYENTQVGDIFVASWGYEQTNIDFYQVTEKLKGGYVMIQEINGESRETGWLVGNTKAKPNSFIGEPMKKKIAGTAEHPGFRIKSYSYASKETDQGREYRYSSYA